LRWALGTVTLIASHEDSDDCIADAADAAAIHLGQAYDLFRALTEARTGPASASPAEDPNDGD
jgi:hypothetical protein